jgi:hypothetical protein
MDTIKRYKALSIVSNVEQGELIKSLIKENRRLSKKNKEREKFYSTKKDIFIEIANRSAELIHVMGWYEHEDEDEDQYEDGKFHNECLQTMIDIIKKEYEIDM